MPAPTEIQYVRAVQDYARNHFATEAVVISAQIESELVDLSEAEAQEYLRDLGVESSGVGALIRAVYHLSRLAHLPDDRAKKKRAPGPFTPATRRRPRPASFIPISSAASSLPRRFISTIWCPWDLSPKRGNAGKLRIEGKEYVVKDGDVVEFRFNV